MPTCTFSGESIKPGTGIMYVQKDGKILWFKNSKCKKNFLVLKRKPVNTRWTKHAQNEKHKGKSSTKVSK